MLRRAISSVSPLGRAPLLGRKGVLIGSGGGGTGYIGGSSGGSVNRGVYESISIAKQLSKAKLTSMVAFSTLYGSAMNPEISTLTSPLVFGGVGGVFLASAAASTLNQIIESSFDRQMPRTAGRPLPQRKISSSTALTFSLIAISGSITVMSACTCSTLSIILTMANFILYSFVYTISKRFTLWNTAIGAVVGSIPPVIGYCLLTDYSGGGGFGGFGDSFIRPLFVGSILFFWQFPHFHSLSWRYRDSYCRSGYWMRSVVQPEKAKLSAFICSVSLCFLSFLSVPLGICTENPGFLGILLLLNGALLWFAAKFYRSSADVAKASTKLFRYTLLYLPVLIVTMIIFRSS